MMMKGHYDVIVHNIGISKNEKKSKPKNSKMAQKQGRPKLSKSQMHSAKDVH